MTTTATSTNVGLSVGVTVTMTETDACLHYLAGTINWGDGTTTDIPRVAKVSNAFTGSYSHLYLNVGFYVVTITGHNYRSPVQDENTVLIYLELGSVPVVTINRGLIRGPILPDNAALSHWVLNLGSDMELLKSDLQSLLITRKGERLMNPDFGTNIHKLVFEPDTSILEAQVQEEISQALAQYEPRVRVSSITVDRQPNARNITVSLQAQALNQFLTLGLNFS
jgi:phage baseplate assembly protein W